MYAAYLKLIITDFLRVRNIISRKELKWLARRNGYEESNAERRLRKEKNPIPCIKLNSAKKPAKPGEYVAFYQWDGGKTIFKKYAKRKAKKKK